MVLCCPWVPNRIAAPEAHPRLLLRPGDGPQTHPAVGPLSHNSRTSATPCYVFVTVWWSTLLGSRCTAVLGYLSAVLMLLLMNEAMCRMWQPNTLGHTWGSSLAADGNDEGFRHDKLLGSSAASDPRS